MLSTGATAGFGFLFWLICARIFSVSDIGIATTLLSVVSMIGLFGLFGFDNVFVRFLPSSDRKDDKIGTGYAVVGLATLFLSLVFLLVAGRVSPSLAFVSVNPLSALSFILLSVATVLGLLNDAIFLSERDAKYSLILSSALGALKILLPYSLVHLGSMGIFVAVAISQVAIFIAGLIVLIVRFDIRPNLRINLDILKSVRSYSFMNYVAGALNLLPGALLPIIVTNGLGPEKAALYYIVMMIGNLLYTIPWATTRALFAEGAHSRHDLSHNSRKSARIILSLLVPAIAVIAMLGRWVLGLFGPEYVFAFGFLMIVSGTAILVGLYSILSSFFRVTHAAVWLIPINGAYALATLASAELLLPYGLMGMGYAWLVGNLAATLVAAILLANVKATQ